jgi:hypothetical protein
MTSQSTCRMLLASATLGALAGFALPLGVPARAADANANQIQPGQSRASQMIGNDVYDTSDQPVGRVVDIILDPNGEDHLADEPARFGVGVAVLSKGSPFTWFGYRVGTSR